MLAILCKSHQGQIKRRQRPFKNVPQDLISLTLTQLLSTWKLTYRSEILQKLQPKITFFKATNVSTNVKPKTEVESFRTALKNQQN